MSLYFTKTRCNLATFLYMWCLVMIFAYSTCKSIIGVCFFRFYTALSWKVFCDAGMGTFIQHPCTWNTLQTGYIWEQINLKLVPSKCHCLTVHFNSLSFIYQLMHFYTGCPRRNVPDFGRVFLMLKYTDISQNTYVQSWTVTEIMAKEKCGLLAGPRTVPVSWQPNPCQALSVVSYYGNSAHAPSKLLMYFLLGDKAEHISAWHSCHV